MAYDPDLAARVRAAITTEPDVSERPMFGGLAFLVRRHMTVVVSGKGGLMLRADPATAGDLVESTPAEFAVMRGRPMRGWLRLDATHIRSDDDLAPWIGRAVRCASALPPKT